MRIIIEAEPKDIAALVLAVQERQAEQSDPFSGLLAVSHPEVS